LAGVDNVLQFTVVASNGEHVTVNQHQHASLFWALRGGGPGSWGVITSTTYATHDEFPLSMGFVFANFSTTPESSVHTILTEFIKSHPTHSDAGWGGYSWLSKYFFVASWIAPSVSWADMNSTFLPFVDFVTKNAGEGGQVQALTAEFPSFQAWSTGAGGSAGELPISAPTQIGTGSQLGSRLLPRKIAVEDPARAATIILETNDIVAFKYVLFSVIHVLALTRVPSARSQAEPSPARIPHQPPFTQGGVKPSHTSMLLQASQRVQPPPKTPPLSSR